jgi:RNA polymerase sigma-70 factor (ECF subfamily)
VTTDEALMLACRERSTEAFAELFARYQAAVCRYFQRRVREAGRAEELAQDTFLALLKSAARYEATAGFRSFLFGIAFRVLSAERRRVRRHVDTRSDPALVRDVDAGIWVRRALDQLDDDAREIVMLREFEELRYEEIAAVLGVPVNTVRSRLFRARTRLRELLKPAKDTRA